MTCKPATILSAAVGLVLLSAGPGAAAPPEGARHIEAMAGCFAVTYRFVEDGVHDSLSPNYGLGDPILEWIELERGEDGEHLVVHYSITQDGRAVPHFHEVWTPDAGAWRQEVWSHLPDDDRRELRYQCAAP